MFEDTNMLKEWKNGATNMLNNWMALDAYLQKKNSEGQ